MTTVAEVLAAVEPLFTRGVSGRWMLKDNGSPDTVAAALATAGLTTEADQPRDGLRAAVEAVADRWEYEAGQPDGHSLLVQTYRIHAGQLRALLADQSHPPRTREALVSIFRDPESVNPDCAMRDRGHGPHTLASPGGCKPGASCGGYTAPDEGGARE